MAGSATITGRQNYVLGIGHPKNEAATEAAPVVFTENANGIYDPSGEARYLPYLLSQSAIPVMVAQSGYINSGGSLAMLPGNMNVTTVTLSATSGSVTLTTGAAIFAGTSADVGKQVTFFDAGAGLWRSALITAAIGTTSCTATLSSTASGTSIASNPVALGNPLPTNYTGGIWVYLPAGAVQSGLAGFYWCVAMQTSSANGVLQVTTAYQSSMGIPSVPTGFVNAVGSGINFTGATTAISVFQSTLIGSTLGQSGSFTVDERHALNNNSNSKTVRLSFGGTALGFNDNEASKSAGGFIATVKNVSQSSQTSQASGGDYSSASQIYASVNTLSDQAIAIVFQKTTAADFMILSGARIVLYPSA